MTDNPAVIDKVGVRSAERLRGGVLIEFEDRRCAFFSDELLRAMLPQAEETDDLATAW